MQEKIAINPTNQAYRALQQDAQIRRDARSTPPGKNQPITKDDLTALFGALIRAIQENGGPVIIGDDTIYRSYNRARQSQSIMMGGVV